MLFSEIGLDPNRVSLTRRVRRREATGPDAWMQALTSTQSDAAALVWGAGFAQREAAGALGITQQAVSRRLRRSRKRLWRLFKGETRS